MQSAEIRSVFLKYFADRGHTLVPSASLLLDDPTLLFVNAGMVPFKPYFLGEAPAPYRTATSVQKVVRTLDIDEVGVTTRHASFFQMAGNFSFGDYFKDKAIPFAWELLTNSTTGGGFGFPEERLWVTVYEDDEEAAEIWRHSVGVPEARIQRRGLADNYWHMGVPGPGGPCSEIYYDRGPGHGREGGPVADEDRYLEVWNLVFMQSELSAVRSKVDFDIRGDLPAKNIDTGLGLERMAAILQGVDNIYEIDTTRAVLDEAVRLSGSKYGVDHADDVSLRVVADHTRTCVFLIGDGVVPGNEGRGYVLRRIMRRVVRNMRRLGAGDPSMGELVDASIRAMSPQYPELERDRQRIRTIAAAEEMAFRQTLRAGTQVFDLAVAETRRRGTPTLSGEQAFVLHDTHGFPIELTLEMAREQDLEVDENGFRRLMTEQRERAKADATSRKTGVTPVTAYRDILDRSGPSEFTGYDEIRTDGTVIGLLADGVDVTAIGPGRDIEVVLDRTPFYAEGGGQLGDHGSIVTASGAEIEVYDVQAPVPGLNVHRGRVVRGEAVRGDAAHGAVDLTRRQAISRAHTATHMVHRAFRELLGDTATQMGSENSPGRLRFDFPSPTPVPPAVLADVEALVNDVLVDDLIVRAARMSQDEAVAMGAMALFGEKYGEVVRVVSVGDWAHELCGGTHAARSGQLGLVKFLSESSIGSGVRRVEALVGSDAYRFLAREHHLVAQLSQLVKVPADELPDRVRAMMARLKDAEKQLEHFHSGQLIAKVDEIIGVGADIAGYRIWTFRAPDGLSGAQLRQLAINARERGRQELPIGLVGASVSDGKVSLIATVNPKGVAEGLSARELLAAALPAVGGRGGGKVDMAQGGGDSVEGLEAAFAAVRDHVAGVAAK